MKRDLNEKSWYVDFIVITLISFLTYTTNQVLNNSTTLYVVSLGSDTAYGGVLLSIFTVAALIARIISGNLIDQRGARSISIIGAAIFGICNACFVLIPDLRILPVWRVLQGVGFAAVGTASGAAVAKILPQKSMSRGIFIFGLGQSLALCFGPYIALTLSKGNDYSMVYFSAAALILVTIPLSLICKYPKSNRALMSEQPPQEQEKLPWKERVKKAFLDHVEIRAIRPVIVQITTSMAVAFTVFYLAYFSADKDYANAKLFFMIGSIAMILLRVFLSPVLAKLSRAQALTFGYFFGIVSLLIVAFTRDPTVFILGGVCYGLFHGTIGPVLQTLSVESVEPERRGAATGTYYFAVDIGMGIGSALWGSVIDRINILTANLCAAACLVAAIILSVIFFNKYSLRKTTANIS